MTKIPSPERGATENESNDEDRDRRKIVSYGRNALRISDADLLRVQEIGTTSARWPLQKPTIPERCSKLRHVTELN